MRVPFSAHYGCDFNGAMTLRSWRVEDSTMFGPGSVKLQWGHDSMESAGGGQEAYTREILQWGHDLAVMER